MGIFDQGIWLLEPVPRAVRDGHGTRPVRGPHLVHTPPGGPPVLVVAPRQTLLVLQTFLLGGRDPDLPDGQEGHGEHRHRHGPGGRLPAQPGPPERQPRTVPSRGLSRPLDRGRGVRGLRVQGLASPGRGGRKPPRQRGRGPADRVPLGLWVFRSTQPQVGIVDHRRFDRLRRLCHPGGHRLPARHDLVLRSGRIPFGGLGGLLTTPFVHPGRFWAYLRGGGYKPFSTSGRWGFRTPGCS